MVATTSEGTAAGANRDVHLALTPAELAIWQVVAMPMTRCCNCGRTDAPIDAVVVALAHDALAGAVRAPHCARCADTAARLRTPWTARLRLFPLAFLVSAFALAGVGSLVGLDPSRDTHAMALLFGALVVGLAVPFSLALRRPRRVDPQTSAYAAIRIDSVDLSLLGEVHGVTLCFTNARYAAEALAWISELRQGARSEPPHSPTYELSARGRGGRLIS